MIRSMAASCKPICSDDKVMTKDEPRRALSLTWMPCPARARSVASSMAMPTVS